MTLNPKARRLIMKNFPEDAVRTEMLNALAKVPVAENQVSLAKYAVWLKDRPRPRHNRWGSGE
jgi:hypothetical protein